MPLHMLLAFALFFQCIPHCACAVAEQTPVRGTNCPVVLVTSVVPCDCCLDCRVPGCQCSSGDTRTISATSAVQNASDIHPILADFPIAPGCSDFRAGNMLQPAIGEPPAPPISRSLPLLN